MKKRIFGLKGGLIGVALGGLWHKILFLLCMSAMLAAAGCAREEQTDGQVQDASSGSVPVARLESMAGWVPQGSMLMGDMLYYMEGTWNPDSGWSTDASVHRQRLGEDAEEIVSLEGGELLKYLVGEDGAVYCIYAADSPKRGDVHIRKTEAGGEVVFDSPVSDGGASGAQEVLGNFGAVAAGAVDGEGRICLCSMEGRLCLFDEAGKFLGTGSVGWDEEERSGREWGIANAGEEGVYAYLCDNGMLRLKKISMPEGRPGAEVAVEVGEADRAPGGPRPLSLEVYSGYGLGLFVSDSDTLWRYDVSEGVLLPLLGWGDRTVNLKGYLVDAVGAEEGGSLCILAHRTYEDAAIVRVSYEEAPKEEKAPVVLGVIELWIEEWEEIASRFNRTMPERQVEVQGYESFWTLQLALAKGEVPDIFSLTSLDVYGLAEGGILEDLSPFFEESSVVGKEDLMPCVLRAGTAGDKYVCVMPYFTIHGLWVEQGTTDKGGWTPEEFVGLAQSDPEALLVYGGNLLYYHDDIMHDAIFFDLDSYVDWERKECFFDSDRFVSLLDSISRLETPNVTVADRWEAFRDGEVLVGGFAISTHESGSLEENGGLAGGIYEAAGYPNWAGEPRFELSPGYPLGMYAGSEAKEEAWAFLEFLLSEEYQNERDYLPARKDSFEKWLYREKVRGRNVEFSDEDREYIRYMVDNAYKVSEKYHPILPIVIEEMGYVCAGNRTAQEAAEIIQSRVTLMLW